MFCLLETGGEKSVGGWKRLDRDNILVFGSQVKPISGASSCCLFQRQGGGEKRMKKEAQIKRRFKRRMEHSPSVRSAFKSTSTMLRLPANKGQRIVFVVCVAGQTVDVVIQTHDALTICHEPGVLSPAGRHNIGERSSNVDLALHRRRSGCQVTDTVPRRVGSLWANTASL